LLWFHFYRNLRDISFRGGEWLKERISLYHLEDDDPQILAERDKIIETLASEKETGEATWKELFTQGTQRTFQRVLLGIGPLLMNQWSGIQAIRYEADLQRSD
jgi:hypothetical protein